MPFLRVIRDKRGYETTYLMHWCWDGHRQQGRVLYAFRTPGGVRVGREALEPEVLRQIEAQYPDIAFDWTAVLQTRQVVDSTVEPRRPRKRVAVEPVVEPRPTPPPQPPPVRTSYPSKTEGATADERIAFLVRWHPVIRERVLRVSDPERQAALLTLADRLDTATWTDADDISAGLGAADEALERLSQLFARRRRRAKKRGAVTAEPAKAGDSVADEDAPAVAEPADADGLAIDESFEDSSSDV